MRFGIYVKYADVPHTSKGVKGGKLLRRDLIGQQVFSLLSQITSTPTLASLKRDHCYTLWFAFDQYTNSASFLGAIFSTNDALSVQIMWLAITDETTMQLLRFHRLDRYLSMRRKGHTRLLEKVIGNIHRLWPTALKKHLIIYSGCVLTALGTTWTKDVDIMLHSRKGELQNPNGSLKSHLARAFTSESSPIILGKNGWVDVRGSPCAAYFESWFDQDWPRLAGAKDMHDVFDNPQHHFHWWGVKFMSVEMTAARLKTRARPAAMADLFAMRQLNGIFVSPPCLSGSSVINSSKGQYLQYDEAGLKASRRTLRRYLQEWFLVPKTRATRLAEDFMVPCFPISTYAGQLKSDVFVDPIKIYHTCLKHDLLAALLKSARTLIDVGSGRLRDLSVWKAAKLDHVTALEPSEASISYAEETLRHSDFSPHVDVFQALGNRTWYNGDATTGRRERLELRQHFSKFNQADLISYMFSFHYLVSDAYRIADTFENLRRHCRCDKGKVVLLVMDGDRVHKAFHGKKSLAVLDTEGHVAFRVNAKYDTSKPRLNSLSGHAVSVFLAGTYGLDGDGLREDLLSVKQLVNKFRAHDFRLLLSKAFDDPAFDKLISKCKITPQHLAVSRFFRALAFERMPSTNQQSSKCSPSSKSVQHSFGSTSA